MNYQDHYNYIINKPELNIQTYLKEQCQNDNTFDWFTLTPDLLTQDGEATCLFYKIMFEDFELASKYLNDIFDSSSENKGKAFYEFGLFDASLNNLKTYPFNPENLEKLITPTKKVINYLNLDITDYSSHEFFVKTLFAKAIAAPTFYDSELFTPSIVYEVLEKIENIVLNQTQKAIVNQTIASLENNHNEKILINYINNPQLLPISNDMVRLALFKPIFKYTLIEDFNKLINTEKKKEIILQIKNSALFSTSQEIVDLFAGMIVSNKKLTLHTSSHFSPVCKKLFNFIHLVELNKDAIFNKIQFEKEWFENILEKDNAPSKKIKM
jgi:hypothetical protein